MCGLAGIAWSDPGRPVDPGVLRAMGDALAHRGPDDAGEHTEPGIGLASRRLAILDLSPSGRMPMKSEDGKVVLAYNGEIFNYVELRDDLKRRGCRFRSGSDTEVLLNLYLAEGIDAVHRLIGMFAFALWDARKATLHLVRDRMGIKPLLYRVDTDGIRFASEMPGLLAEPGFAPAPDPEAVHHLLALRFVPRPRTALSGVLQLPPAHVLSYERGRVRLERYWSIPRPAETADRPLAVRRERLMTLLDEAVKIRLRSDVPVALLLSGGLDSSIVAYHMRRNLPRSFKAFTVGFEEADYDERPRAREVARRFGIELEEIEVTPQSIDDIEGIVAHMQVPFADPSLLPTWALAREVARHVKVALIGDGADELFGGYDRYRAHLTAERFGWLPGLVSRSPFYALVDAIMADPARRNLPGRLRRFFEGWELPARERNARWLANPGTRRLARLYQPEFAASVARIDPAAALTPIPNDWGSRDLLGSLLRADQEYYLPDDLLFKADIASMAFGLELRLPYLDHRLVEFAATVPSALKIRGRRGKWLLRHAYKERIPRAILKKRKAGFGIPLDHWLRGDMHAAARDLLLGPGALSRGYLNRDAVAAVLKVHHSGQRNYDELIWTLLILEIWLRSLASRRSSRAA